MQIHELNNYSGSLDDAYLAADNGSDTGKMKTTALTDPLNARIDNIIAGPAPSAAEIVDARLGADGVTYPSLGAAIRDQVTDLKSDLANLIAYETITNDITDSIVWNQGYMSNNGVTNSTETSMHYTNKIPVSEGDVITTNNFILRFITAFSGTTAIADKGDNTGKFSSYTVPSGVDAVVITVYVSETPVKIIHTHEIIKCVLDDDVEKLKEDIVGIESNISNLATIEEYTEYVSTDVTPIYTAGFCNPNTGLHVSQDETIFEHTQKIQVSEGDIVTAKNAQGGTNIGFRFVACFNGDVVVPSAGSSEESVGFTVPSGVTHIIPTLRTSYNAVAIVVSRERHLKACNIKTTPMGFTSSKGDLSNGQSLYLPYHNVKNHNVVVFSANVSSFGSIKIGKEDGTYITVDETNVSVTCDLTSQNFIVAHELTIQNNIQVVVENETSIKPSRIRVLTCGNEFEAIIPNNARFLMDEGSHYVTSINSTLTDCAFSWTSRQINKPIWLFGDSYFSWYPDRWTYYLARDGFTDSCMLNGFAGENSAGAYSALENLLKVHTPKMVVWCQGMNNPDNNDAVNESWKSYYDKVVLLSKKYGFELVLYTTPTTPTMNNRLKNDIVRNSGYRYVEADKSLRIDDNGNWIEGTLDDNVHPTIKGAKLLYHRFLADIPELASKC